MDGASSSATRTRTVQSMITLTRLSGTVFLLNPDLTERVVSTPDTVIHLVDGKKYVVAESMREVLSSIVSYRGEVVAQSALIDAAHASMKPPAPRLASVRTPEEVGER